MSRLGPRAAASAAPQERKDELEELGDEAIIAHQAAPHAPQRRALVNDDARSIVISEQAAPPAACAESSYRAEHAAPTVVVRDRRDVELARRRILARRRGEQRRVSRGRSGLWIGLGLTALIALGCALLVSRWAGSPASAATTAPLTEPVKPARPAPPPPASTETERPTPKVSLEELPLERPRRR